MQVGPYTVERTGRFWFLIDSETGGQLMDRHAVWGCAFPTRADALSEAYFRINEAMEFAATH